ncbi:MAG: hypothetical protein CMJ85_01605 [Planctomycetes bacterium]|jgi:hypothetical protein|nr:hypothetical protein [Planctomycetota bacterium]
MGSAPELIVIGLACNLVGLFLLANSIVFRSPRHLIAEFFGVGKGTLRPLRDYVLNKIQVVLGFLFLTGGLVLQAWSFLAQVENKLPTILICGVLVAVACGVALGGTLYSRRSFRHYLREFFHQNPFPFAQNMELTKQIGKAFGIPTQPDESVERYVARVMLALGLDPKAPVLDPVPHRKQRLREMAPLPLEERQPESRFQVVS